MSEMVTVKPQSDGRRRLVLRGAAVALVVAVATLAAGIAFARFSAGNTTESNQLAAGTVTLTSNVSGACSTTNMLPGSAPAPCTLTAAYGGTVSGWMALDVLVETQAGNGGTKLYTPIDAAHDLQVTITSTSPSLTYTVPTSATMCPGSAPSGSTCYELDNELVSATPFTNSSPSTTFSVTVSLPAGTTTGYRGGAARVILTAHAVQSGHNPATGCIAGQTCTVVHWS